MEFLIFVFILISIVSSLTRQAKKNRKKEILFDPWSFEEDLPEDQLKNAQERMEVQTGRRDIMIEDGESEIEEAEEQEPPTEAVSQQQQQGIKEFIFSSNQELEEQADSLFLSEEKKEKQEVSTIDTASINLEKELNSLLSGRKLSLAIVVSEILGPPRALKPARSWLSDRLKK